MTYCVLKNSKLPILEKHSGVWPAMMIQEINDRIQIQKLDKILDQASNFSNLWFWYLVQALFSPARSLGWVWFILIISVLLLSALSLPWVSGHLPLSFLVLKSFFPYPSFIMIAFKRTEIRMSNDQGRFYSQCLDS